ncbi:MAG TPA: ferritin-like domain-containing protein [Candidatus Binataceae bacterium]|nr:ferritin-like domain-containing protein [Candidatus Binataceae bacterium]
MSTADRYAIPVEGLDWKVPEELESCFKWEYEDGSQSLHRLYEKGKSHQWNASNRIDWSLDLDPENPEELPDEYVSIFGSPVWNKMTAKEKAELRRHLQSSELSQFLHGEQGALICTAKIVQQVPDIEAKFYAATQVMDEARHVEVYKRLLHEKFELAYPIMPPLKSLLEQILRDSRWDMTYLGMQVLIEGLALAAFAGIRDMAKNSLAAAVNAYVMQDEARHVAFGRLALREYYPHLTQKERDEREEFVVEACYFMRDRFTSHDVYQRLGLPVEQCIEWENESAGMKELRSALFTRIVPAIKDIGLWGPKVTKAYADMGVLAFGDINLEELSANDETVAEQFDAQRSAPTAK